MMAEDKRALVEQARAMGVEVDGRWGADKIAEKQARKMLMDQAKVLRMKVDTSWDIETLAEMVADAHEAKSEADEQALRDTADTWVHCVRDCWLGTERHNRGSVIKVPKELYASWKATGAARLADTDEIEAVKGSD
jgi:hypothetical protein